MASTLDVACLVLDASSVTNPLVTLGKGPYCLRLQLF